MRSFRKNNEANAAIILGIIAAIVLAAIISTALIWGAMKSAAADVTTFVPSLSTIVIVSIVAGIIIAAGVLLIGHKSG